LRVEVPFLLCLLRVFLDHLVSNLLEPLLFGGWTRWVEALGQPVILPLAETTSGVYLWLGVAFEVRHALEHVHPALLRGSAQEVELVRHGVSSPVFQLIVLEARICLLGQRRGPPFFLLEQIRLTKPHEIISRRFCAICWTWVVGSGPEGLDVHVSVLLSCL
jgi:hypothetical protein